MMKGILALEDELKEAGSIEKLVAESQQRLEAAKAEEAGIRARSADLLATAEAKATAIELRAEQRAQEAGDAALREALRRDKTRAAAARVELAALTEEIGRLKARLFAAV